MKWFWWLWPHDCMYTRVVTATIRSTVEYTEAGRQLGVTYLTCNRQMTEPTEPCRRCGRQT